MNNQDVRVLLERLNDRTATAIEDAAAFASTRTHYEITIEHLMIKMLEDGNGDLELIFDFFGIDVDKLWQDMLENLSRQRANNTGKPSFSPLLFQWFERAWTAATLYYDENRIRSAMLLDALIQLSPLLPGTSFNELDGISLDKLRSQYTVIVDGSSEAQKDNRFNISADEADEVLVPKETKSTSKTSANQNAESALSRFTENVTFKAASGKIDPVLGRDEEIRLMIDILSRRRKNNPILVGEPGVGKTALVEGFALRIAHETVPDDLKGVQVHTLDLGLLQAGAGVKGEFEKRLKQVITEVKDSAIPIIMFIDEAHTLIGAGGEAGMSDAANLLKPALARGELRTIAATTWSEYKKYFERDAALERRFQVVKVEEPTIENAIVMLNGLKVHYQTHHGILITDDAVETAVHLSSRYITGRFLPDKAIDLLDTAAARIRMGQAAKPASIESAESHVEYIERRLDHLASEQKNGLEVNEALKLQLENDLEETKSKLATQLEQWEKERELVGNIQEHREQLTSKYKENIDENDPNIVELKSNSLKIRVSLAQLQGESPMVQAEVNGAAIAEIIADWTGVPVGKMVKNDLVSLMELEERLRLRVIGQDDAISAIARSIRTSKAGLSNDETPLGVFLLAGPSGVGKTETARLIADEMFGSERSLITINMSEYQEAHTVSQLKGSPPGYVGYGEGGILTEAVRKKPYSLVLLDEVEKAHADVMNLFYQVFDRGFMRDGEGREIDFKNTIIIMTSNLGTNEIVDAFIPDDELEVDSSQEREELEPPELESSLENDSVEIEKKPWQEPTLSQLKEIIQPALLMHFAPALLGRMQVIPYRPLNLEALQAIVAIKLDAVAQRIHKAHNIAMRCEPSVFKYLADQCTQPETGARFINALIEQQLLPEISRSLLQFMADDDIPDVLSLELDDQGQMSVLFSDLMAEDDDTVVAEEEVNA
ncbi:ClpB-like protein [hydrothermal vent metagenome]|uniref:ClpB-like protein n=1 Tax=hydrothermal vent metagenome TaxID=652676 RepID=A0A3B1A006_9ZZZZ